MRMPTESRCDAVGWRIAAWRGEIPGAVVDRTLSERSLKADVEHVLLCHRRLGYWNDAFMAPGVDPDHIVELLDTSFAGEIRRVEDYNNEREIVDRPVRKGLLDWPPEEEAEIEESGDPRHRSHGDQ
jgi:hypothetical protein